ncbi:MAG: lipoyl synthase [Deltaproteobacteria bacterium]|nr:lipoyl synthase [Deltaproteobacteria bacterium]
MQLPAFTPQKKPSWLKVKVPGGENYTRIKKTLRDRRLYTVCEEAHCPNVGECWDGGTATFMIMGDLCTRGCRFCAVKTARQGIPLDFDEPKKVSESIAIMDLSYVVITSVNRDDLIDGGSSHFANVIAQSKKDHPELIVEVLTPDFMGQQDQMATVANAFPHVFAHNLETVRRLTPKVRDPRAHYDQSLGVLKYVKENFPHIFTKSSLMLGLGERDDEVLEAMQDLRRAGVSFLTLGQYLRPTQKHLAVEEFVTPEKFNFFKQWGETFGFDYVAAGPLVRSSYKAGEFFIKKRIKSGGTSHGMENA